MMTPKLHAFDLDGTLLDSRKRISAANAAAVRGIVERGASVAVASGRIASSIRRYVPDIGISYDTPMITLNGAEVYAASRENAERIYYAPLDKNVAKYLIDFASDKPVMLNFYYDHHVYSMKTQANLAWTTLYKEQTGVENIFVDDFATLANAIPSKIIFVGAADCLDEIEAELRAVWSDGSVYVCRSWDHYLEFMDPAATKGRGLAALCGHLKIALADVVVYGDADNDIPMFEVAGASVAMKNASPNLKAAASRVIELTNDDDWVRAVIS